MQAALSCASLTWPAAAQIRSHKGESHVCTLHKRQTSTQRRCISCKAVHTDWTWVENLAVPGHLPALFCLSITAQLCAHRFGIELLHAISDHASLESITLFGELPWDRLGARCRTDSLCIWSSSRQLAAMQFCRRHGFNLEPPHTLHLAAQVPLENVGRSGNSRCLAHATCRSCRSAYLKSAAQ